ncbi:hypothetical protein CVT91_09885 [Candidatus Atribacteria bacterium HGW-Atribacteria-1]|nr:MAG: hypothetical protein CVT91_09885 [Candidatus Atribacteria bacterium HGW-Atribacteria-1]
MKYPKQTKKFGYPPKIYYFTGEYSKQALGYYKSKRNKKIVYAPIYENEKGERIIDMKQIFKKGV